MRPISVPARAFLNSSLSANCRAAVATAAACAATGTTPGFCAGSPGISGTGTPPACSTGPPVGPAGSGCALRSLAPVRLFITVCNCVLACSTSMRNRFLVFRSFSTTSR